MTMDEITKLYYESYLTFSIFLEFRIVNKNLFFKDKAGNDTKRNMMFSKYAKDIDEVQKILDDYSGEQYIIYVGSNARGTKSRTDASIEYRTTFFFDIEASGEKPELSDENYYNKLKETASYLYRKLDEIGIKANCLKESGKGIHLGVKIKRLEIKQYDKQFKIWWKQFTKDIEDNKPFDDIKFSDNMSNPSRIESAPGTLHNKYPSRPPRRVLFLELHENDIIPVITQIKVYESKGLKPVKVGKEGYNNDTIYQSEEFLLLENHRNLPEGSLHNTIIMALKCLVRDYKLDARKMEMKLAELGYNEVFDEPSIEKYVYTKYFYFNWCLKNCGFCVKNDIPLNIDWLIPKKAKEPNYRMANEDEERISEIDYNIIKDRPIQTYRQMKEFIREYNTKITKPDGDRWIVFENKLKEKVKNNCVNKNLFEFVIKYGLWDLIKGGNNKDKEEKI